jgi:hypothetical protein
MMPSIAKMDTAKEAWDAIAIMRIRDDRVKKSTTPQIQRKFDMVMCGNGETVEDYALCLNSMIAHLATLGAEVKETQIMEKMLRSLPQRFKHITIAIKTLLDVSMMSVVDLTGRLKEAEEAFEEPPATVQHEGRLYLMEEEWVAQQKKCEASSSPATGSNLGGGSNSSSSRGRSGQGRERGHGGRNGSSGGPGKSTGDECHRCGKMGH